MRKSASAGPSGLRRLCSQLRNDARCYSLWMAGGGVKGGIVHGETDEFSYNIIKDPVHIRDFQATLLHLFGIDHERFTYNLQGLDAKLTGVEPARVVDEILA